MGYMFNSKRFITIGIDLKIPPVVQSAMFSGIEIMRNMTDNNLDYLQVFRLRTIEQDGVFLLHIKHNQEFPEAEMDYVIPVEKPINEKVYIIDNVDHVTMLLAEEY